MHTITEGTPRRTTSWKRACVALTAVVLAGLVLTRLAASDADPQLATTKAAPAPEAHVSSAALDDRGIELAPGEVASQVDRTENVRPIPPGDPDFQRMYRRRNDAESINRALDDTLWLRRARSIGHERQHLNLLTYALTVNALGHQPERTTQRSTSRSPST